MRLTSTFSKTKTHVYLSIVVQSVVYDVTKAAEFYGPGAGYHCFAGREASVALAKLSFEESALAEGEKGEEATKMLSAAELDQLQDWINKFEMKGYPVVGRVVKPAPCKVVPAGSTHYEKACGERGMF